MEEELWEQAFIEACFEDMLAEEELHWYFSQLPHSHSHSSGAVCVFPFDIPSPPTIPRSMECKRDDVSRPVLTFITTVVLLLMEVKLPKKDHRWMCLYFKLEQFRGESELY